jgi:hypothetical protein
MYNQGGGVNLAVRPALGQGCSGVLGHLGCLETCGLEGKERLCDGHLFTRPGFGERRLGALLKALDSRRIAIPALAAKGNDTLEANYDSQGTGDENQRVQFVRSTAQLPNRRSYMLSRT